CMFPLSGRIGRDIVGKIAFWPSPRYASAVSLAEIKTAVETLSADELTELAAFIRERDNAAWDRQIDSDFTGDDRLHSVAEESSGRHSGGSSPGPPVIGRTGMLASHFEEHP